jgi:hypothetical protein
MKLAYQGVAGKSYVAKACAEDISRGAGDGNPGNSHGVDGNCRFAGDCTHESTSFALPLNTLGAELERLEELDVDGVGNEGGTFMKVF